MGNEVCVTKHQIIEEPCEAKVSSTVLKTSGTGDSLAEFNGKSGKKIEKVLIQGRNGRRLLLENATLEQIKQILDEE